MYINSNYGGAETSDIVVMEKMIVNLEHLLFKYRVNIGFYGHNHAVQRMSAVYDSVVEQAAEMRFDANGNEVAWHNDPQATVHMVIGTGGAKFTVNFVDPYPEWCEKVFYRYGYAKVAAVNSSYLQWDWIDASDNQIYDRMVITQNTIFSSAWVLTSSISDRDNDNDDELSDVVIAFIAIGCIFVFVFISLFAYRTLQSEFTSGTEENRALTLSPVHGDTGHHIDESATNNYL